MFWPRSEARTSRKHAKSVTAWSYYHFLSFCAGGSSLSRHLVRLQSEETQVPTLPGARIAQWVQLQATSWTTKKSELDFRQRQTILLFSTSKALGPTQPHMKSILTAFSHGVKAIGMWSWTSTFTQYQGWEYVNLYPHFLIRLHSLSTERIISSCFALPASSVCETHPEVTIHFKKKRWQQQNGRSYEYLTDRLRYTRALFPTDRSYAS